LQSQSKFRLTDNSIEFYSDTNGVSNLIPDSLKSEVSLDISETVKLVNFPYLNKEEWLVFKRTANFGG